MPAARARLSRCGDGCLARLWPRLYNRASDRIRVRAGKANGYERSMVWRSLMKPQSVPITMGSMRSRSLETGTCLVTEAWFPAGSVLEPHTHSRPVFAFMLAGGFLTGLGSRRLDC